MNRLRELRLARELSLGELERITGIAKPTLQKLEGTMAMAPKYAKPLARVLGVHPLELVDEKIALKADEAEVLTLYHAIRESERPLVRKLLRALHHVDDVIQDNAPPPAG